MRTSGVLLPISSLPSMFGIGSFSKSAYEFVNQLKAGGQTYWQVLPIGPTGFGDSPYQSVSTFAGNPYYIDLGELVREELLTREEVEQVDFGHNPRKVDYAKIYHGRFPLLRKAYNRSDCSYDKRYNNFKEENNFWLDDYALYMAIKDSYNGASWLEWDDEIKFRKKGALQEYQEKLQNDIEYYKYIQYLFIKQWNKLKRYANINGVKIIGDIPIYVALDSADTWANPELYQFDNNLLPIAISGCPPDAFSIDGQLWGNPLYDWDAHKKTGYKWWISRIEYSFRLYDELRIDHFKGFDEYYSIPYGRENARIGEWEKGPGYDLFKVMEMELGNPKIIAEDLGYVTDSVKELLKKTGFPGMKILEFAFNSSEIGKGDYLPCNFEDSNCVVYTGTHDNQTVKEWITKIPENDVDYVLRYCDKTRDDLYDINWHMIRLAQSSVADYCIIPIQDYLGLGEEGRINQPATVGSNWTWRLLKGEIKDDVLEGMKYLTELYGRI